MIFARMQLYFVECDIKELRSRRSSIVCDVHASCWDGRKERLYTELRAIENALFDKERHGEQLREHILRKRRATPDSTAAI